MAEDWISITEAAKRLTAAGDKIDRSSLSRYLKQHGEALPLRKEGKANLVDFEALAVHRGENARVRVNAPDDQTIDQPVGLQPGQRFKGTQSEGLARKALADAESREMDLAKRRRELTPVAEVDKGGREAIVLMRAAFERAVETNAAALSLKYGWDERQIRVALKEFSRRGLEVFHAEILKRLDAMSREENAALAGDDEHAEIGDGAALQ